LSYGFIESNLRNKPFAFEIGLITTNVEESLEQAVTAGAQLVAVPKRKSRGQAVTYVRDLDGFFIETYTLLNKI
jgi:hypothetical protein